MYLKINSFKIAIILLINVFYCTTAQCEEKISLKSETIFEYVKKDCNNLVNLNFPEFSKEEILGSAGLMLIAFAADEEIRRGVDKNRSRFLKKYVNSINDLGHYKSIAPIFLTLYGTGILNRDERMKKTAFSSLEASLASGGTVLLLKRVFGRSRPYMEEGNSSYSFLEGTDDDRASFPSGHSAVAWALFTPYAKEYGKWVYIVPASVSFARVYKDKHWSSDVVVGAVIGYAAGTIFYKWKDEDLIIYPNGFLFKY